MKKIYELDRHRFYPDNHHHSVIAVLTGLPVDEIIAACPDKEYWCGQDLVRTFNKLGFNTNPRFIRFDKDTIYPCLMRTKRTDVKEPYWYCFPYYNGLIYYQGSVYSYDFFFSMERSLRITSMLQVWI